MNDIAETAALLDNYKQSKMSDISRYNTLEEQLDNSEELISTLSQEIDLLTASKSDDVAEAQSPTNSAEYNLLLISMMQDVYRKQLLQSETHKDLAIQKSYISQLSKKLNTDTITTALSKQDSTISQKKADLILEQKRIEAIKSQLDSLSEILKERLVDQKKLEAGFEQKVSARENLNKKIKELMLNSASASTTTYSIAGSIEDKKGFLPWPISNGKVELRYGEQKHPDNEKLIYVNSGIDLSTADSNVNAVYSGTVISVQNISSNNITMILQHDNDYYTVYSNLSNPYKRKGDIVSQGESIAAINRSDNQYVIHFEIWKGRENLNPYHWLKNN